jgi:asparagine synthase (glutamine-hydrolysing)
MVHRGPDDEGVFIAPDIGIGVRRLAIMDIKNGGQPMYSSDGRHTVVFNGEIYNYVALREELQRQGCHFATNCDTEVVLRLFEVGGIDGFQKLEGMFGVAVWDQAEKRLTIARDWLGQKSVYWTRCQFGWAFASEIKALLVLPGVQRRMDLTALSHYMSLRYLPGEQTFFDGIHKLPAAHALEVTRAGVRPLRLWTPKYEPKTAGDEAAVLDELDSLLNKVVSEHLMSDVPLGAFLSGGIDSSLMVAYAARASKEPLRTFSVGVDDESQSELPWARRVAERYQTRHIETTQDTDLAALTPRMVAALEEPVDPFACGVYVVSRAAAEHVKVVIGGDGGDELFAGYDRYKGQELAEIYSHVPRLLRHKVLRPLLRRVPDSFGYKSFASKLRWLDETADFDGFERYAHSAAILRFTHARKQALFTHSSWARIGTVTSERLLEQYFQDGSASAFVDRMLHADCMTRLSDGQLPITDKMAMAHSLELRSPFLDRRVAEFAMRIPAQMKLKNGRLKYVTRRIAERYLPLELVYRRKQGFGFPLALWLRGRLRPLLRRVIEESRLAEAGVFRTDEMMRLAQEHWSGESDHNYRLWMLFNLEMFWRHFIDGVQVDKLEDWIASSMSPEAVAKGVEPQRSLVTATDAERYAPAPRSPVS